MFFFFYEHVAEPKIGTLQKRNNQFIPGISRVFSCSVSVRFKSECHSPSDFLSVFCRKCSLFSKIPIKGSVGCLKIDSIPSHGKKTHNFSHQIANYWNTCTIFRKNTYHIVGCIPLYSIIHISLIIPTHPHDILMTLLVLYRPIFGKTYSISRQGAWGNLQKPSCRWCEEDRDTKGQRFDSHAFGGHGRGLGAA